MIRTVIFDLDGLLVDSEPVWFQVRTDMCSRYGLTWTDDDQKALMGRSTQAWIDYVTEKMAGHMTSAEVRKTTIDGMVGRYRSGAVRVMPGAQKALEYCRTNMAAGLASGSPEVLIEAALSSNGWNTSFSEVLSSDYVANGKPFPDVYLEVMKRMKAAPDACAVVEDSGSGILAGKAAGAHVVAVPNERLMPSPAALAAADTVLTSLSDLPAYLDARRT